MNIKPDFIIGGTSRAGSTFLAECLNVNDNIYIPKPYLPEPKILTDCNLPDKDYLLKYTKLFKGNEGKVLGEKTVNYLENMKVATIIKRLLPETLIIFILRNPIERAVSNWKWSVKSGYEKMPFNEAVMAEGERRYIIPDHIKTSPYSYLYRGCYYEQLLPYIRNKVNLKIIIFEDLINETRKVINDLGKELKIQLDMFSPMPMN